MNKIQIKKEQRNAWLTALRSGKYSQSYASLMRLRLLVPRWTYVICKTPNGLYLHP